MPRPGRSATARRARRKGAEGGGEEGGAERWLVTYADMLTLLLVLFIVLFSISVVNTSKFIALRSSLSSAFGSGPTGVLSGGNALNENSADQNGTDQLMPGVPVTPPQADQAANAAKDSDAKNSAVPPADYTAKVSAEVQDYKQIEAAINSALKRGGMSGAVQFAIDRRGLIITVVTNALVFPGNSANLLGEGQHILSVIAPPLLHSPHNIEVDGHTNQEKVSTAPYPSGWELSSARASAVVRYLIAAGIAQSRLSAVGYSDQRPLYPASDPRSITRNRRVEIVVLSSLPAAAGDALQAAGADN
jgi:chemotaxis protein MotB